MLSVEEALDRVRAAAGPPRARAETVPLAESLGRTLAEDVRMDHDVPPFRRATMDGFAVVASRAHPGATFRVAGRVLAGEEWAAELAEGDAVRIMTGAPLPRGAVAVVPLEAASDFGGEVRIDQETRPGDCVTEAGEHMRAGQVVAPAGTSITPAVVGVLATAGRERVPVAVRPRVAVLGTGSEIVEVRARPGPAGIRNSNGPMLLAQARRAGAETVDLGLVKDEISALRYAVRQGLDADVLLVSGGVSRGEADLVPAALVAEGVEPHFHRWAVQPGGPLWFGTKGTTLVFGLPGNPQATFVGFEVLGVPALRTRLGRPFEARRELRARHRVQSGGAANRARYRPARLRTDDDGVLWATIERWKGSGDPFASATAEALLVFPRGLQVPPDGVATLPAVLLEGGA
jgi:molybdopterin molybdotransferase